MFNILILIYIKCIISNTCSNQSTDCCLIPILSRCSSTSKTNCIENTSLVQCDIRRALSRLLNKEAYKTEFYPNGFFLYRNKKPLAAIIIESVEYDQTFQKKPQKTFPNGSCIFNKAGMPVKKIQY